MATAAEQNLFSVEKKSIYSLSSKGEVFDEDEGPHIVKGSDLDTLVPSTGLGPLFLMHHENLTTVILQLEHKKNMKVLVQKCMITGYIETGVADDLHLMHFQKGHWLAVSPIEQVIVAGLRILFYFGGTDIEGGLAGCQLYMYQDEITTIKVVYYFNGQRVMLSLIEQPGECSLYLYCED
jgi:hypothetical protein